MSTTTPTPDQQRTDLATRAHGVVHVGVDAELTDLATHANLLTITALHNPDHGRLALVARPAERRTGWVLRDVLAALGIDDNTDKRGPDTYRDLARTWLPTHHIRHLLVASCERLHPDSITELATLAAVTDTTLWLLATGATDDATHDALATWTDTTITWAEFADAFADVPDLFHPTGRATRTPITPTTPVRPATEPGGDVFPRSLPYEDFPTFRTACTKVLPAAQAQLVETQLRLDVTLAAVMFDGLHRPVTEADIATHLHARYRQLPTDAEVLVATRGTQIAAFTRGLLLKVDTHGLLATAADNPRPASRNTAHWDRLRHYPDPATGAICALAATDLDARTIAALTLDAVAPDGSTVTVDGHTLAVEPGARPYLQAMVLLRRIHGAGPDDKFLASPDGNTLSDRVGATTLNRVRIETGLALTSRLIARERLVADRWTTRYGICLQSITTGGTP